jgi:hypothetical protein
VLWLAINSSRKTLYASFEKQNKMKFIYIIYFLSIIQLFSQNIEKRIGEYKIDISTYRFSESEKKIKIGKSEFYFDNSGKILEKISYGRHHYNKLDVIGNIEQFEYQNSILKLSRKYTSWCKTCEFDETDTKYNYNNKNELINEILLNVENDSIIMSLNYLKEGNSLEIHSGESTYIQKIYNDNLKLIELNQIYEDSKKIRWQYLFSYGNNWKRSNFQTYYGDGKENSKTEIEYYDKTNRIITKEILSNFKTKIVYIYSEKGLLKEIKEYESYNDDFKLKYVKHYKFKGKVRKLNNETIKKINDELIGK